MKFLLTTILLATTSAAAGQNPAPAPAAVATPAPRAAGKLSFGFIAESRDDRGFPLVLRGAHQAAADMKAVGLDISIQSYAPAPDDAARSSAIDDLTSGPFPAPVDALAIQGSALSGAAAAAAAARSIAAGVPVIVFDTETTGAPGAFASVVVDGDAVARMMKDAGARDGASLAHLAELSDNRAMLVIDRRPYDQGRRCVELMVAKNQGQTVSAREALAPVAVTFRTLQRYLADMKGKGIAPENGAPWPAPPGPGSGSAPGAANPAAPRR